MAVIGDGGLYSLFGDRGLDRGQIDDGFAGGVGRDQGGDGEVVQRPGVAAGGLVDRGDGVVGNRVSDLPANLRWWRM